MHGMAVYIHLWMCDKKENCGMRYGYPIIVDLTGPPMPTSFVSDFFRNSSANGYDHYLYGDGYLARFRPGWSWNSSGNNQVAWSEATSTPYDKPWKNAWYIHIHDIPHRTALRCTALHCTAPHCTALHCTALHCTAYDKPWKNALVYTTHCAAFRCTAFRCTALHFAALHCTALHYTILH